jgi:ABC-type uncharacterized transport system YnjBCD ATPase subunit
VLGAGLGGLTGVFGQLARARAGVRRTAEVFAVPPVGYGERALPPGPGELELRAVTVRAGDAILLDRVDLTVPGGAAVAVVGRSGAGKSVLAAVAARLRDPDAGQVLLDGVPVVELGHHALRAAVGSAFERPVLVGGTVADAIGLGADPDAVRAAACATHAHEFVSRLPHGYDTPLAEAPMSGGEAQRLGLARAWPAGRPAAGPRRRHVQPGHGDRDSSGTSRPTARSSGERVRGLAARAGDERVRGLAARAGSEEGCPAGGTTAGPAEERGMSQRRRRGRRRPRSRR